MSDAGFQSVVGGGGAWSLCWCFGEIRGGGAPRRGWVSLSRSRSLLLGSWWFGTGLKEEIIFNYHGHTHIQIFQSLLAMTSAMLRN